MNPIDDIVRQSGELARIRRDIHAHPEIGFQETRTSDLVAGKLQDWGIEVHRGIGKTGLVGIVRGERTGPRIGLRADMDALPMAEATGAPHASKNPGVFHGCGHDGHTTMLLGAAQYLATTRNFPGEIALIFQPAEEGLNGAGAMIGDGLFRRFPCDEIYALHNWPNTPLGQVTARAGAAMAGSDNFDIHIAGAGAHEAQPDKAIDPVMVAVHLAQALQTVVSRNVSPLRSAILSITQIEAGSAYNVIPETARLGGTLRTFDEEVRDLCVRRIGEIAAGVGAVFGAKVDVDLRRGYRVLRNDAARAEAALSIAAGIVGAENATFAEDASGGSEDFAEMLNVVPGAYLLIGQGDGPSLHNPAYDFNDSLTPIGASVLARLGEERARALANRAA